MSEGTARIYRKDYRPSAWLVDSVDLRFELDPADTRVTARLSLRRNPDVASVSEPLTLHGEDIELLAVRVNGTTLAPGDSFRLQTTVFVLSTRTARARIISR